MDGLRLAVPRSGVPSPWSEFCKAIFHVKGVDYVPLDAEDPAARLTTLLGPTTGQQSLPVAFWNKERPRSHWLEILHLAERIKDRPPLLPAVVEERARTIGLCAELCGEDGFGWHRRILIIHTLLTHPAFGEAQRKLGRYLAEKYGYQDESVPRSRQRCEASVAMFARIAIGVNPTSSSFFDSGRGLTALDLCWAAFAAFIRPLPPEDCPMSTGARAVYTWQPTETAPELVEALLYRRDRVYRELLELPVIVD